MNTDQDTCSYNNYPFAFGYLKGAVQSFLRGELDVPRLERAVSEARAFADVTDRDVALETAVSS